MALINGACSILSAVLLWLWRWLRILWVCRVAAVSSVGGGLFIVYLPQTLDLFADTGLAWWHWAIFLSLVFAWAWIVHITARRALQFDDWLYEGRLGRLTPERRQELQQEFRCPAVLIPRGLGILVFGFVAYAMWTARRSLADAVGGLPPAQEASGRILLLIGAIVVLAAGYAVAVWLRRDIDAKLTGKSVRDAPLLAGKVPLLALLFQPVRHQVRLRLHQASRVQIGLAVAWVFVTGVFGLALVHPHLVADWLPRALFLPILIGGGVLLFGEIAALSHRLETPLLVVIAAISVGLAYWFDHYNDTRWTTPPAAQANSTAVGATRQISFAEAVKRWRIANKCADPISHTSCPDPILIAGAGGASPAAFQTATVVGALLDLNLLDSDRRRYADIRNRIFGFSTVSGSSLAAAVIRAALTDAIEQGNPDKPPCTASSTAAWWGATQSGRASIDAGVDMQFDPSRSWRDCFQQLLAGDYLSPVMVGLAYRDHFPFGNPVSRRALWPDRAALLEEAFERRYYNITGKGAAACDHRIANGMCRRLGYHPDPQTAGAWLPLLFINGASVATGRRILASDVSAGDPVAQDDALVRLAYDVLELRSSQQADSRSENPREAATDLMLSTAATMSCRFPLISPHGAIRDRKGNIVDRIVDGGYFENDGLATAADIVRALRAANLRPIVIRIGNEPVKEIEADRTLPRPGPPLPNKDERALFDVYFSIVRGILATRSGHEDGHAEYLKNELNDPGRLVEVTVRPIKSATGPFCRRLTATKASMQIVSMSWWLSQPVQAYLDAQLCAEENWEHLVGLVKSTRGPTRAPWLYEQGPAAAR
jgi:hypothetical protein